MAETVVCKEPRETWMELARRVMGNRSDDELSFLLWNFTAFPFADAEYVGRQLEHLKRLESLGQQPCFASEVRGGR